VSLAAAHSRAGFGGADGCLAVRWANPTWGLVKMRAWLEQHRPQTRWPAASTIGGMGNLDHETSYAYAGFIWTLNLTERLFGDAAFGGAIYDGQQNRPNPGLANLGCRELLRGSIVRHSK